MLVCLFVITQNEKKIDILNCYGNLYAKAYYHMIFSVLFPLLQSKDEVAQWPESKFQTLRLVV